MRISDLANQKKRGSAFDYFRREVLPKALKESCDDQVAMMEQAKK